MAAERLTGLPAGRKLVFVGFMGAGKSTTARAAAQALDVTATDLDDLLEERFGKSIARVFAEEGEVEFRAAEEAVALDLLQTPGDGVVALGGGTTGSERVRHA